MTAELKERAETLKLYGLLSHWDEVEQEPWLAQLLDWEETERARRGLERRLQRARLGTFRPLADYDWSWPKKIDRAQIEELLRFAWLDRGRSDSVTPFPVSSRLISRQSGFGRFLSASEAGNSRASISSSDSADTSAHVVSPAIRARCR